MSGSEKIELVAGGLIMGFLVGYIFGGVQFQSSLGTDYMTIIAPKDKQVIALDHDVIIAPVHAGLRGYDGLQSCSLVCPEPEVLRNATQK